MKICKNCKKTIEDEALVCPYCGCVVKKVNRKKDRSSNALSTKGVLAESGQVEKKKPKKKRKTWLWVLGWIFVFPVPLTILLLRSQKVNKIVKIIVLVIAWLFYLLFASAFMASEPDSSTTTPSRSIEPQEDIPGSVEEDEKENIKDLTFTDNNDVTIKAGESISQGYLKVNVKSKDEFTPEDVAFVSDDSDVVQVSLTRVEDTTNLYFDIIAVSGGETNVYAQSKDGSVKSKPLHVIVQEPIKVESIELQGYKSDLLIVGRRIESGGYGELFTA